MNIKTRAIVISALKYQEKSLIVKCFTKSDGLKSYFVRDAFSSRKTSQKNAYFQPLTILEIEAVHKNKGTLEYFREIKIAMPFHSIHADIAKSTIVMFVSEMLHHSIREEEKNEPLFSFLETALDWLDSHDQIADFHLILLLETTKYLGFYPDVSHLNAPFFEMTEGMFSSFHAISSLSASESELLKKLIGLKFGDERKIFTNADRKTLLKILVDYYAFHLDGFKRPKSLEILKEVFS